MRIDNKLPEQTVFPPHSCKRASRIRREEGNILVEIALLLPVFLALVTGIGSFGVAFSNQLTLTYANDEGARALQRLSSGSADPCQAVFTTIQSAAPSLNASNIGLTLTIEGTPTTGTSCTGQSSAFQTALDNQDSVIVSSTYPCNLSVYGIKFAGSCQLSARVTEAMQ